MSVNGNLALRLSLGQSGYSQQEAALMQASSAQATSTRITGGMFRVAAANSGGNGSAILPQILTGENAPVTWVVNDSPYTINVFPASGESIGAGATNAAQTIATNTSAVFVPVDAAPQFGGGYSGGTPGTGIPLPPNWRVGTIA
jgi:hypothetical protein